MSLEYEINFCGALISDLEENIKKLRIKVKEVLNLFGEDRIVLDFDYLDSPFGEA